MTPVIVLTKTTATGKEATVKFETIASGCIYHAYIAGEWVGSGELEVFTADARFTHKVGRLGLTVSDVATITAVVEALRNAPLSPEDQRAALAIDVANTYSANHFPGSAAWLKHQEAVKALAAFDAKQASQLAAGEATAKHPELPALAGTESQVRWAVTLRATFTEFLAATLSEIADKAPASDPRSAQVLDAASRVQARLQEWTQAKQWIDNRGLTPREAIRQILAGESR